MNEKKEKTSCPKLEDEKAIHKRNIRSLDDANEVLPFT